MGSISQETSKYHQNDLIDVSYNFFQEKDEVTVPHNCVTTMVK